jgi:hypothetical protein
MWGLQACVTPTFFFWSTSLNVLRGTCCVEYNTFRNDWRVVFLTNSSPCSITVSNTTCYYNLTFLLLVFIYICSLQWFIFSKSIEFMYPMNCFTEGFIIKSTTHEVEISSWNDFAISRTVYAIKAKLICTSFVVVITGHLTRKECLFDLAKQHTVSWHWISIALLKLDTFIARNWSKLVIAHRCIGQVEVTWQLMRHSMQSR